MKSRKKVALHVDTTGLKIHNKIENKDDRIVQIDAIELNKGKNTYHQVVDPERSISREASKCHGLKQADVKGEPTFADVEPKFSKFIKGAELITHNANFTTRALNSEFTRLEGKKNIIPHIQTECPKIIDVMVMDRELHPEASSHKLEDIRKRLGISPKAGNKTRQIAAVYEKLSAEVSQKDAEDNAAAVLANGFFGKKSKSENMPVVSDEKHEERSAKRQRAH